VFVGFLFASLDLKSSQLFIVIFIASHDSSINHSFDSILIGVELLLCCNELFKLDRMLVLLRSQHHIHPLSDIADASLTVFFDFSLGLLQVEKRDELRRDGRLDYGLELGLLEVHGS
jgi:hypothetical protein